MRLSEFNARAIAAARRYLLARLSPLSFQKLRFGENTTQVLWEAKVVYSSASSVMSYDERSRGFEGFTFADQELVSVKEVILDSFTGMSFDRDRNVICESTAWPHEYLRMNVVPKPPLLFKSDRLPKANYICLSSIGFYHWLIEDLGPFIFALRNTINPVVLVNENPPPYVKTFLELIPDIRVLFVSRFVELPEINFVTRNANVGWPLPMDLFQIRDFFAQHRKETIKGNYVYVSRINASRSPVFEKKLVEILSKNGWLIIDAAKLLIREQIEIFSSAEVIAGVHGAGLSGVAWMNEGAKLIEIGPDRYVKCFSRLANNLDVIYNRIAFTDTLSQAELVHQKILECLRDPYKLS